MGGADCFIAGIGTTLCHRIGHDSVVVATADSRLSEVLKKCSSIGIKTAEDLGLDEIARGIGLKWSTHLYPKCLHFGKATVPELKKAFLGWPLPSRKIVTKLPSDLTDTQQSKLWEISLAIKSEFNIGPDSLPYTCELDDLQTRFGVDTGVYMTKQNIARTLLQWRKNPKGRPVTK